MASIPKADPQRVKARLAAKLAEAYAYIAELEETIAAQAQAQDEIQEDKVREVAPQEDASK